VNRIPRRSPTTVLLAVLATMVLSGCAGTVGSVIPESSRDTSGRFDGLWTTSVKSPGGRQNIERWQFNCAAQDFAFDIVIKNGLVQFANQADNQKLTERSYVDEEGRFRLELPLDAKARAGGGSDSQISDGRITVILEGELSGDDPNGFYTAGIAQFLNRGCRYPVDYEAKG